MTGGIIVQRQWHANIIMPSFLCCIFIELLVCAPLVSSIFQLLDKPWSHIIYYVVPSPPPFLPPILIVHRVQESHCSLIFHRIFFVVCLVHTAQPLRTPSNSSAGTWLSFGSRLVLRNGFGVLPCWVQKRARLLLRYKRALACTQQLAD